MNQQTQRIAWDDYFLQMAKHIATRSTCLRRQVGAVAVRNKRILATGYNGAPSGLVHCIDTGKCLREEIGVEPGQRHELCQAAHAEQNVICQAASSGVNLNLSVLYISGGTPCSLCAKLLINVGVSKVICDSMYPDDLALKLLDQSCISLTVMDGS